ncbi:MAG: radical SAM protein, partial [Candidatus Delongbacteria bacterium]|nr:radical SAM protein [Candidatus Delongbacteria bacterium]
MIIDAKGVIYFVDINRRELLYLHPVIAYLIKNEKLLNDMDEEYLLGKFIKDILYSKNIQLEDMKYYISKFVYLKKMKLLEFSSLQRPNFEVNITEEIIDHKLANITSITFEVTENCNLRCEYCGYGEMYNSESHYKKNELSFEKVRTFLNLLHKARLEKNITKMIILQFYGGEPLMKLNIIKKTVNLANELFGKDNTIYGLTTNGMFLNQDNAKYLIKNNFDIYISLDGNKEENSYRKDIKGKNSFETVVSNLSNLRNNCSDNYFQRKIKIIAVAHDKNSRLNSNYIFKEYKIKPRFTRLCKNNVKLSHQEKFKNMNSYSDNFFSEENSTRNYFENFEVENHWGLIRSQLSIEEQNRFPTGTCTPFYNRVFVTVN